MTHNRLGLRGVHLCRLTGRYRAEITHDGKHRRLGRASPHLSKLRAYDDTARDLHASDQP
jgi:hypothetical protein